LPTSRKCSAFSQTSPRKAGSATAVRKRRSPGMEIPGSASVPVAVSRVSRETSFASTFTTLLLVLYSLSIWRQLIQPPPDFDLPRIELPPANLPDRFAHFLDQAGIFDQSRQFGVENLRQLNLKSVSRGRPQAHAGGGQGRLMPALLDPSALLLLPLPAFMLFAFDLATQLLAGGHGEQVAGIARAGQLAYNVFLGPIEAFLHVVLAAVIGRREGHGRLLAPALDNLPVALDFEPMHHQRRDLRLPGHALGVFAVHERLLVTRYPSALAQFGQFLLIQLAAFAGKICLDERCQPQALAQDRVLELFEQLFAGVRALAIGRRIGDNDRAILGGHISLAPGQHLGAAVAVFRFLWKVRTPHGFEHGRQLPAALAAMDIYPGAP